MLKCQVGIVNPTYENNNLCNVQYVPYCISTLKIQVINHENGIMNIRIYPINNFNTDDYCGGYDDNQKGIKIIWGSGFEDGVELDLVLDNLNLFTFLCFILKMQFRITISHLE